MRHAFCFHKITWRSLICVFDVCNHLQWAADGDVSVSPFSENSGSIPTTQEGGKAKSVWVESEPRTSVQGSRDRQRILHSSTRHFLVTLFITIFIYIYPSILFLWKLTEKKLILVNAILAWLTCVLWICNATGRYLCTPAAVVARL